MLAGKKQIEIGLVHMIIIQGQSVESVTRLTRGWWREIICGRGISKGFWRWQQPEVVFKGKKIFLQEQVETN